MSDFAELMPHGKLTEVFSNIYLVTGTSRPTFQGQAWQFSRNMTVIREGGSLTLINTVRLDDEGLAALDALGAVQAIIKLGAFHGMDDAFYLNRYPDAKLWAPAGMPHDADHETDVEMTPGGEMPFKQASLFVFESSKMPEGLIIIEREGGILIACDSLQNWDRVDEYFSDESGKVMTQMGFIKPANIGPGWRQAVDPQKADFDRVSALSFKHLIPAHGTPLLNTAHEQLSATFAENFPESDDLG